MKNNHRSPSRWTRRDFLASATIGTALFPWTVASGKRLFHKNLSPSNRRTILLFGSASRHNIGSMAHIPSTLAMLETYLPEADVIAWPSSAMPREWQEMVTNRFPRCRLLPGGWDRNPAGPADDNPSGSERLNAEQLDAIDRADFMLHGSGGSFSAERLGIAWQVSGKPFGVYGVTCSRLRSDAAELLHRASFLYLRDSVSVEFVKQSGLPTPVIDFAPDSAFAFDVADHRFADDFLTRAHLTAGKYLCVIPRYRKTPHWILEGRSMTDAEREIEVRNQRMAERDHRPLLETIRHVLAETDFSILLCPEDRSQMALGRQMLYDPLSAEEKKRIVRIDDFWQPDEALGVYLRSAGLFGLEMHSPIFCVGHAIPAAVCRFDEQTSKGIMWRDIGLGDWLFEADDPTSINSLSSVVLSFCQDPATAREKASDASRRVRTLMKARMEKLRAVLHLPK